MKEKTREKLIRCESKKKEKNNKERGEKNNGQTKKENINTDPQQRMARPTSNK